MSEHEGHDRVSGHIERVPPTQKPRVNARCQEFVVEGGRGIKAQLLVSRLRALKLAPDTLKRGVAQDSLVALCSGNQGQRPEEHHGEGAYQESHGHDYDRSGSEKSKHFLRRFGFENLGEIAAAEMRSPQKGGDYKVTRTRKNPRPNVLVVS